MSQRPWFNGTDPPFFDTLEFCPVLLLLHYYLSKISQKLQLSSGAASIYFGKEKNCSFLYKRACDVLVLKMHLIFFWDIVLIKSGVLCSVNLQ